MTTLSKKKLVVDELKDIPDNIVQEVLDFIRFLKYKGKTFGARKDKVLTSFASESSLSKDWLKPEEEEAWKNL